VLRQLNFYYIYAAIKCALEDEMGRACSTHEEKRNAYRVLRESEDLDVGGRIILRWISERWDRVLFIWLKDRAQRQVLVNTVMNLRAP
jgi:hypothetical protein